MSGPRIPDDPHARLGGLAKAAGFAIIGQGQLGFLAYASATK